MPYHPYRRLGVSYGNIYERLRIAEARIVEQNMEIQRQRNIITNANHHIFSLSDEISELNNILSNTKERVVPSNLIRELFTPMYIKNNNTACGICLENIHKKERVFKHSCGNMFHPECIYLHTETSNKCPLCRYKYVESLIENPFIPSDS